MERPQPHKNEKERIVELESYSILDTLGDEDYDNLTLIASEICQTPIALVSLIDRDRQWFKSHHGLDVSETPREFSFCAHAINDPSEVFYVKDAREDIRFFDNPLVEGDPHVVFYAGVPLKTTNGLPLGTLCVIDHKPRELNTSQKKALHSLSNQVMKLLELRKKKMILEQANKEIERKNEMLQKFVQVAAHDIKSPLNNIRGLAFLFMNKYGSQLDEEGKEQIEMISQASLKLAEMVDGMLENARNEDSIRMKKDLIYTGDLVQDIKDLIPDDLADHTIDFNVKIEEMRVNKSAILQVLINLITNAIKYNDKVLAEVEVGIHQENGFYELYVSDNGPGIATEDQEKIFEMFTTLDSIDRYGEFGTGIGLSAVKSIIGSLNGEITLNSDPGEGTIFTVTIPK